ncbi:aminopeptidase P family protein [bacterium]|nr:aminopeptidase P family protein [bacterium]
MLDCSSFSHMARPKLIIASSEANADMLYASSFRAPDAFSFLEVKGKTHLLLSDLEVDRGRAEAKVDVVDAYSNFEKIASSTSSKRPAFAKVVMTWLIAKKVTKVEVPSDFPLGLAKELKALGLALKPSKGAFLPEREIKSLAEIEAMEAATRIAEAGMSRGLEVLRGSKIQKVLRLEMETAVLQAGGVARGDTIVACGEHACDPHARGTGPLFANQLIILDIFPRDARSGYHGDLTRTIVRGNASDAQRHMWETCLTGQKMAIKAMKPGVEGGPVHEKLKQFFAASGYPTKIDNGRWQGFFHGTGHGLGLEVHESPRFGSTTFFPGQIITVEPGIYMPGLGGVRHEDVALIRKGGVKLLTQIPKPFEI